MFSSGSACCSCDTCREGDAPAPARAHRGTTSLAVPPASLALGACDSGWATAHWPAVTGRTRPVLLGRLSRRRFFRGLAGDGRVIALCFKCMGLGNHGPPEYLPRDEIGRAACRERV